MFLGTKAAVKRGKAGGRWLSPKLLLLVTMLTSLLSSARAGEEIILQSGSWQAGITDLDGKKFYGVGSSYSVPGTDPQRTRTFTFFISGIDHKFRLLLTYEGFMPPRGSRVSVNLSFLGGQQFNFQGEVFDANIMVLLQDSDVASWAHAFTADRQMSARFPTLGVLQGAYDLTGTTQAVGAIATAVPRRE